VERLGRVREDWGKREVYGSEAFFHVGHLF
jgi:hypothetical protein